MRGQTWGATNVDELLDLAQFIIDQTQTCACADESHQNAMHDLAFDAIAVISRYRAATEGKLDRVRQLADRERTFFLGNGASHVTIRYDELIAILDDPWADVQ